MYVARTDARTGYHVTHWLVSISKIICFLAHYRKILSISTFWFYSIFFFFLITFLSKIYSFQCSIQWDMNILLSFEVFYWNLLVPWTVLILVTIENIVFKICCSHTTVLFCYFVWFLRVMHTVQFRYIKGK